MNPIRPADRLAMVSEYYFSTKLKEVDALNKAGKQVINLGVGGPDLPPSPEAIKVLAEEAAKPNTHGYQPYNGVDILRQAFADWYARWFHVTLDPEQEIQPLIGSKEGILHISMAFLNPGDGVLVPDPGYPTYSSVSRLVQAEIYPYPLLEENGWQPDFEALEAMDLSRIKLMWVNYPNMPTGGRATPELFEKLVDFSRRHGIVVCNDNPYSFILNRTHLSILNVPGAKDTCIELNSMSKSHNMPGWRIGMLATNATFLQWIMKVKSNVDSGQFRPMQLAAATALKADESWYENLNQVYSKRRLLAEDIMKAIGCTWDPTQTGLFLWGKIPDTYPDAGALADKLLYEASVFATPGFIFGSRGNRYLRISLCCHENQLIEACQRIRRIM
jgi:aspartate/methionine/tyrosine aminotransferase